ncbi:MAG: hypothetical protein CMO80_17560 [Verrucomicrobiales bacterium]|nr:hypothetical protein [Verrucomicrobiales bacterium]|tara:strand:- start:287 stop:568 length:282 start_codon:yes stop_codon:yes gene_type:complete
MSSWQREAEGEFAGFKVQVDGKDGGKPVKLKTAKRDDYSIEVNLPKGKTTIAIAFTNDKYSEGAYDRNLFVHKVALTPRQQLRKLSEACERRA